MRQADFLFERKRMDEFARCVRMLLAPHFYEIYLNNMALLKKRLPASERGSNFVFIIYIFCHVTYAAFY